MINFSVYLLLILICSFQCFSQCSKSISEKYGTTYYKCADGSISFAQPKSEPMVVEWKLVYSELKKLLNSGELESFPYQKRKKTEEATEQVSEKETKDVTEEEKTEEISEEISKEETEEASEKKKSIKRRVKDSYRFLVDNVRNYKEQLKVSEGKCGATAGANVFNAYCDGLIASPDSLMKNYFRDTSPGILPETLKVGLNKLFSNYSECIQGKWKYYYSNNKLDFLDSIYKYTNLLQSSWAHSNSPLIVLTGDKTGESLHYITIVSIYGYNPYSANQDIAGDNCKVTYNDQDTLGKMQTTINCRELVQRSKNVSNSPLLSKVLKSYTRLVFLPY